MTTTARYRFRKARVVWTGLALLAVLAAFTGTVDTTGQEYARAAFSRALITFAVARTLNGVISVAQGTEVAVEPGGVGVNFSVGEVLDPINDLVERFSAVMLVATSSLGLQNVLLRMSTWWGTGLALAVAALFALAMLWWPGSAESGLKPVALKILLITVFLRFSVSILVIGSNLVFDTFLAAEQTAATVALEATRTEIQQINEQTTTDESQREDQSMVERLGSILGDSLNSMNVNERLDSLQDRVSNASEHIVNLIVIFLLQTVILPLVFLWLFVELLKMMATRTTLRS